MIMANQFFKNLFAVCIFCLLFHFGMDSASAQFSFELKIEYAMQVGNTEQYSVSGIINSGRIESGKTYFLEDGSNFVVKNIISSKSATSVPIATTNENVSLAVLCKTMELGRGDIIRAISTRPTYSGSIHRYNADQIPEGNLRCRLNGKQYNAQSISKPVYIRVSNVLDLFFMAEDESVIWLQLHGFSDIENIPHQSKSDTSEKNHSLVCKVVFMPKGYRPTDMPNRYIGYEDCKGNAGIIVTNLQRHKKKLALEFSGILRPNETMYNDNPATSGLFYITEGRVDNIGWDEF
jgi:hypothetical protein